jgi:hypothetical protein
MVVALILLGIGGFVFPPLWLVFLVVLLAFFSGASQPLSSSTKTVP